LKQQTFLAQTTNALPKEGAAIFEKAIFGAIARNGCGEWYFRGSERLPPACKYKQHLAVIHHRLHPQLDFYHPLFVRGQTKRKFTNISHSI
jgi:hypothetical protein